MANCGKTASLQRLNNDVLLLICSETRLLRFQMREQEALKTTTALRMLSLTNHFFRELTAPTLFRHINISGEWDVASRGLQTFADNPGLLRHARSFEFRLLGDLCHPPILPKSVPDRLIRLLGKTPKLENLAIVLPYSWTHEFDLAFEKAALTMPAVKNLVIGLDCQFAIRHCPNVETVSSFPWDIRQNYPPYDASPDGFIAAAGNAPKLTYFEMSEYQEPSASQVAQIYNHMPNLECLCLFGKPYLDSPKEILPIVSRFPRLAELVLAPVAHLNAGFDPPWCGNAYMGSRGKRIRENVRKKEEEVQQNVARAAFDGCKSLHTLWLGSFARADAVRDEQCEVVDITWARGREQRRHPSGFENMAPRS